MANSKATFRPPTFKHLSAPQLADAVDAHLPRLFGMHESLNATAIKSPAFGVNFATNSNVAFVQNGQLLGIPTGLSSVTQVVATPDAGNGVPLNITVTAQPSKTTPGTIDIFIFQPTSNVDNTPVLATGTAYSIHWSVTGQAETTT